MTAQRRIAIVADDAAALPPEWVFPAGTARVDEPGAASDPEDVRSGRPGLAVVAMPVTIDGEEVGGTEDQRLDAVEDALAQGRRAATSRPSPGQLLRLYRRLEAEGFEGIVSVHCSAELSGSATSARIASAALDIPVEIVDTRTIGMAEGHGVMAGWQAAGDGADLARTAEAVRSTSAAGRLLVRVPSLDTLRRGGRIGPSTAALGSMLHVKPILRVTGGQLAVAELPLSETRARARLVQRAGRALAQSERDAPELTVHHLQADEGRRVAQELAEEIAAEHCPHAVVRTVRMPAVLAAHTGLGALGLVVLG